MIITRVVLKSPRLGAHPQVSRLASWSLRCVAQYFSHSFGPWTLSELYQLVSVIYFNTPTNICQSERFAEHLWETGTRQSLISLVAPVVSDLQSRWVLSVKHQEAKDTQRCWGVGGCLLGPQWILSRDCWQSPCFLNILLNSAFPHSLQVPCSPFDF